MLKEIFCEWFLSHRLLFQDVLRNLTSEKVLDFDVLDLPQEGDKDYLEVFFGKKVVVFS
jgi:hypothetical protein